MSLVTNRIKNIVLRALLGAMFFAALIFFTADANADDLDLRVSGEVQYKYTPNGAVILGQEHRLHLRDVELHETFTSLGVYYRLTNWFTTGSVYRMVFVVTDEGWALEHRPYVDLSVTARLFSLDLVWRPRVEYRLGSGESSLRVRKKVKVKFKTIPGKPFIADEIFIPMEGPIERNRVFLGFSPLPGLTTFYLLEVDFDETTEYKNIIGLDYKFSL
jgi:hypothetical protein